MLKNNERLPITYKPLPFLVTFTKNVMNLCAFRNICRRVQHFPQHCQISNVDLLECVGNVVSLSA